MTGSGRRLLAALGAWATCALLVSCSGRGCRGDQAAEDEPSAPAKKKKTPRATRETSADPCQRWADAICRRDAECFPSSLLFSDVDEEACRKTRKASCDAEGALPGAEPLARSRAACAAAMEEMSCRAWNGDEPIEACTAKGSLADGDACVSWAQCASGYCNTHWPSRCGTCATRPKIGERCPDYACERGAHCDSDDKTCKALAKKGSTCKEDWDCVHGLVCAKKAKAKHDPGVCGEPLHSGEPCVDPWSSTPAGAPTSDAGPRPSSPLDLLRGDEGPRGEGEIRSCDYAAGLDCVRGRCGPVEFHSPGEACATGDRCKGGSCRDGKCVRHREAGESCAGSAASECRWPARCLEERCVSPSMAWCTEEKPTRER